MPRFVAISCVIFGFGCSPSHDAGPGTGGSAGTGNDSGPLGVSAVEYDRANEDFAPLADGDDVHLVRPPQGGHVIFIGARVEHLDSTTIELKGRIRDPDTNAIVVEDTRTVVMEPVPGKTGWLQPDHRSFSQVANIALCPDYDAVDVVGRPYLLELEVTELYAQFSTGSTGLHVTPVCTQTDPNEHSLCSCECSADYTLGKCPGTLDADAGSDASAAPDSGS